MKTPAASKFLCCTFLVLAKLSVLQVFGGEMTVLPPRQLTHAQEMQVRIHAPNHAGKRIRFRFEFENKPLAEGTLGVELDGKARLVFEAPPPPAGLYTRLELLLSGSDAEAPVLKTTLWIFPDTPWFGEKQWLKDWPLWLYDPRGNTASWLERHEVPHTRVFDPARLGNGALLVGEGISFQRHCELVSQLHRLAGDGIPVLVLAPSRGVFDLPVFPKDGPPPNINFQGIEKVTELDPRLKGAGFSREYFNLHTVQDTWRIRANERQGWPWVEFYDEGGAPLLFCGVPLTTYEHDSPAPLLLLDAILRSLHTPPPNQRKTQ